MSEKYYYHAAWLQNGYSKGRCAFVSDKKLEAKDYFMPGYRILSGPWPSFKEAAKGKLLEDIKDEN